MGVVGIILYLAIMVFMIASVWKVFTKAGKPGWAVLIPIYNFIVLIEIVGKPTWWVILLFVPFVNYVILIWITNLLSKSFGKDVGFTLGLLFLGIIFFPVLGFGSAEYKGPAAKEAQQA
ncbi:MAG: DUF5684 domain-containing protein [Bacteroidales bacterium]|nr:DUF5684 domain-containing protein [Bacteroidales bacterium]